MTVGFAKVSLMGEESKVRVKTMPQHRHVIADLIRNPEGQGTRHSMHPSPSFPRRRESTGWGTIQGVAVFLFFRIEIMEDSWIHMDGIPPQPPL